MALSKTSHDSREARELRKASSLPKGLLWRELRRNAGGMKFRNQHLIGDMFDFYCAAAKLGSEIDGIAHDMGDRPERDVARSAWLLGRGIRGVRIPAQDVLSNSTAVAEQIVALCTRA